MIVDFDLKCYLSFLRRHLDNIAKVSLDHVPRCSLATKVRSDVTSVARGHGDVGNLNFLCYLFHHWCMAIYIISIAM